MLMVGCCVCGGLLSGRGRPRPLRPRRDLPELCTPRDGRVVPSDETQFIILPSVRGGNRGLCNQPPCIGVDCTRPAGGVALVARLPGLATTLSSLPSSLCCLPPRPVCCRSGVADGNAVLLVRAASTFRQLDIRLSSFSPFPPVLPFRYLSASTARCDLCRLAVRLCGLHLSSCQHHCPSPSRPGRPATVTSREPALVHTSVAGRRRLPWLGDPTMTCSLN